jgi:prevent-host-death family protein
MTTVNVTEARARLYSLIDEAASSHKPIIIRGKRGNAVLLSVSDWNAIAETLLLLSIPGMSESFISPETVSRRKTHATGLSF